MIRRVCIKYCNKNKRQPNQPQNKTRSKQPVQKKVLCYTESHASLSFFLISSLIHSTTSSSVSIIAIVIARWSKTISSLNMEAPPTCRVRAVMPLYRTQWWTWGIWYCLHACLSVCLPVCLPVLSCLCYIMSRHWLSSSHYNAVNLRSSLLSYCVLHMSILQAPDFTLNSQMGPIAFHPLIEGKWGLVVTFRKAFDPVVTTVNNDKLY